MSLVGGFGCLELVLYGIRVLAEQHYEPFRPMRAKHCWPSTNKTGEHWPVLPGCLVVGEGPAQIIKIPNQLDLGVVSGNLLSLGRVLTLKMNFLGEITMAIPYCSTSTLRPSMLH